MLELLTAGGWLMVLILICSVLEIAICIERLYTLNPRKIAPPHLLATVWKQLKAGEMDAGRLKTLKQSSPLGRILAAGLLNRTHSREVMKEAIGEVGRQVVSEMERYLNTLGTIASIAPLLGLLGTVIGMIKVFTVITSAGVGNPTVLAGGISEALITTAAGLSVAIPSLIFHRYLIGRVDRLAMRMEEQALKIVEVMQGEREVDTQ